MNNTYTETQKRKKSGIPLANLANYHQAQIDRLERVKREADQNENDDAGNPTYNDEWNVSLQGELDGHYRNLNKLNRVLES